MNKLAQLLETNTYIVADGGIGTCLMADGLAQGDPPEEWNVRLPDRVRKVHRNYIEAGSQIILTNSFGGTRFRLKLHKLQDRVADLNYAAAQLARIEADAAPHLVIVGGSIGPSGEIIQPLGELSFEEAKAGFAEQAAALTEGGADVLWIETMSDLTEIRAAIEGARSASNLPLVLTMTFDTNGHTMMGISPPQALEALREFKPIALGGNCGNGVAEIERVIQMMYATDQTIPLVAKSNAGIPQLVNGVATYNEGPAAMAEYAVRVRNLGATIIGACCGSTPEHIWAMVQALRQAKLDRVYPRTPMIQTTSPVKRRRERRIRRRE